jgi:glycosyltransferase involved in cell wall biosynthesis
LGQLDRFKFKLYEKNTCQKFDQIWVTSPEDLNKFTQWVPAGKIKVVPNGVDLNFFQGKSGEEGKKRLIFLGLMSYFPNIEAVLFFTNEIFPLIKRKIPEIDFFIIGPGLDDEKGKQLKSEGIKIIGPVKDVRKFLSPSSIMVVPLKKGGGTRLKILESFALECPVVSTSIGCEGLAVQHNKHLLIADTPTEFAQAVVRLVKNEKLRHQITREAKKLVEIQYSWSLIGERARRELTLLKRSLQWINS